MTPRKEYLLRAVELSAKAQAENDHARKYEFKFLPRAFLRLAEKANVTAGYHLRDAAKKDCHRPTGQPRGR